MKSFVFCLFAAALVLVLSSSLSTVTLAAIAPTLAVDQTPPAPGPSGDRAAKGQRQRGLLLPGLGSLPKAELEALKLTAEQQLQVAALHTAQHQAHERLRAERQSHYAALKQQLDAGKLDPRALAKRADAHRAAARVAEDQALVIWDGLSEAQKTRVTAFIKARYDNIAKRRAMPPDEQPAK
jgi:Spy/CpxP family protein refolding chaperone